MEEKGAGQPSSERGVDDNVTGLDMQERQGKGLPSVTLVFLVWQAILWCEDVGGLGAACTVMEGIEGY